MIEPSLTGWRAQYDRFQRSHARVVGPYRSSVEYVDDLHHFMQDCWHLKDWIKNDPATGLATTIETQVLACKSLRIAADLANGSKHLNRHTHREGAYVTSISVTAHLNQNKPVDVECVITLGDGTQTSATNVVHDAFADWNTILMAAGLVV
jgi:hypothetical protein